MDSADNINTIELLHVRSRRVIYVCMYYAVYIHGFPWSKQQRRIMYRTSKQQHLLYFNPRNKRKKMPAQTKNAKSSRSGTTQCSTWNRISMPVRQNQACSTGQHRACRDSFTFPSYVKGPTPRIVPDNVPEGKEVRPKLTR